jgi:hypothetical protein
MKRQHQILAGILAVQVVLSIFVFWPRSGATAGGNPLFPDLESTDVIALTVTDADGKAIVLRKVDGDWVLPEADDYPADAGKITPVISKILGLNSNRLVTRTAASHGRLQVSADDFVRRLDFETADGAKHTIYLGSSPSYGATHFREEGRDETYLTDQLSTFEASPEADSWIDTSYLAVTVEELTRMSLENANGSFDFTKDEEGNWTMAGLVSDETLDQTQVGNVVRRGASLNMVAPLGKEELDDYAMQQPNAFVTLETADETITVRVGAQDPDDNSYVVASSDSEYYVRVSEYGVKDLVESTREDFLEVPTTPTPGEE